MLVVACQSQFSLPSDLLHDLPAFGARRPDPFEVLLSIVINAQHMILPMAALPQNTRLKATFW